MGTITVVSFGLEAEKHLTLQGLAALQKGDRVIIQSRKQKGAAFLDHHQITFETLDTFYEQAEDFDQLHQLITDYLLTIAQKENVVYGVIDASKDESVFALIQAKKGEVVQLLACVPLEQGALSKIPAIHYKQADKVISALAYEKHPYWPGESLIVVELYSSLLAGEIKLWLMTYLNPDEKVFLVTPKAQYGKEITLADLDRQPFYDEGTCLYVPVIPFKKRGSYGFYDLLGIIETLRSPTGCPWDREQTHESLRPYLIEEAYEAVAAIDDKDMFALYDELGDVLLQVVLHSQVGKEHGNFTIEDVVNAISQKMIHRHPHVFSAVRVSNSDEVVDNWAQIKQKEKGIQTTGQDMVEVPSSFPALLRAQKVQSKARQVGFDWDSPIEALEKVFEEAREVAQELENGRDPGEELGDLLFACVNVARIAKKQPELLLHEATQKFIRRFVKMENTIKNEGKALKDLTFSEMDVYWNLGKCEER